MFLKTTRMMYFDTLNSNMTIAKRYKKLFSSYEIKNDIQTFWKIFRIHDISENCCIYVTTR